MKVFAALIVAAIIGWAAYVWLVPSTVSHPNTRWVSALSNTKQLTTGMLVYLSDSDECFPPAERWSDAIAAYIKNPEIITTPESGDNPALSSALNGLLASKQVVRAPAQNKLVVFCSVDGAKRNAWGGPANASEGRPDKGAPVGFLEGSVRNVRRKDLPTLKWRP